MKVRCSNDERHKIFRVIAHVTQEWIVDANGDFEKCVKECVEVTHFPDKSDIWVCAVCGAEAETED